jgi:hypothetical protein
MSVPHGSAFVDLEKVDIVLLLLAFFEETVRGLATYCDEKLGLRELVSQSFI